MPVIEPAAAPRKLPRQARSRALVEAIIEATARIFERAGPAACTTNAVAEKAGVSIGSLYQYFPNRRALTAALVARERGQLVAAFSAAATRPAAQERLSAMIHAAVAYDFARPALAAALDGEEAAPAFAPHQQETLAALHRCVMAAIGRDETAAWDVIALAQGMIAMAARRNESDGPALARRIERAVFGYLGWPAPDAGGF
ncbi:TetR/AcrR family transcriptional regulator [Cronobacter dublinensis]|uniref:TetR/AcrR family transcriptional regulator n=1 Tax=Cronobacter dublinensis TaxID=413497 RepID=UPI000CFDCE4E|nr:TetR/AcrR family transcriptional regulator [Cronobacter dublinensis]EKF2280533.1 TetR/AcrR family transcriptional regulator [Cronobacter dublinensis]EKF2294014.1 TetR/AcrR family transcriptional regulator [Cronobacter dublinensis]EKF2298286.1 TetR/AcrR family transcriptional regulator [Cronobacter dublinensis]EKK5269619.1 TetR/AcrR family transcriptional regulator [Cronobacter dublinensis]EKM0138772.1 TetR/AcrR family transcriptional regulator [Cronobacter dublinensis]